MALKSALKNEMHVDNTRRSKPENERAASSPNMNSSLATLSSENNGEYMIYSKGGYSKLVL